MKRITAIQYKDSKESKEQSWETPAEVSIFPQVVELHIPTPNGGYLIICLDRPLSID